MIKHFAKTFDLGEYQLLVFIDRYEEDDAGNIEIHQIIDIGQALLTIKIGGPEAVMQKAFDAYGQEQAENFLALPMVEQVFKTFVGGRP